jgi:hypothetical protein
MKTPRELLLAKHDPDASLLDELRRKALPEPRVSALAFLRLVFFPQRRLWGALALVWVAALVFALADSKPVTRRQPASAQALIAEWTANQDKIHDLFAETGAHR